MMITAHSPVWADADHTAILLLACFPWLTVEVTFSARPEDSASHGRELFDRAMAGDFGPVAEYVAPVIPPEQLASAIRRQRDHLLTACDWTQARDLPADFSAAWEPYRQALRDITAQSTFPQSVIWPEAPQ